MIWETEEDIGIYGMKLKIKKDGINWRSNKMDSWVKLESYLLFHPLVPLDKH